MSNNTTQNTASNTANPFPLSESLSESLSTSSKCLNFQFHCFSNRQSRRENTFDSFQDAINKDIAETINLNLQVPSYTNVNAWSKLIYPMFVD